MALILATVSLGVILSFSIMQHLTRDQDLMERFLLEKGETIITAIEAGMRTSMMHFMGEGDPLQTLITESSRENDIIFIRIMNRQGQVVEQTEDAPKTELLPAEVARIMKSNSPIIHVEKKKGLFVLSKRFRLRDFSPGRRGRGRRMLMMGRGMSMMGGGFGRNLNNGIVTIGLSTKEFDLARRQDIRHAFFMGAILFLVGSAGLYFLFLYQGIRVAETTLANMKLYTNNVVESIPVGIVTLDTQDRIVSYNRKMEVIAGRSLEKNKGERLDKAFPGCPIDINDIRSSAFERSLECQTGEGTTISMRIGASSLVNNDGEVIGTVLIIRDMTAIKEMEQQLERSRRMAALGKMAAGIAHEIRNPLGTLRGFAHYFGNQPSTTEESKGYADLMISEVDRLNRNISGLLQFARPREPQFVSIELDKLIAKTASMMEGDLGKSRLKFHQQCKGGISFEGDPDLLLQVLMNLLKNSIHASPEDGEVSLMGSEDEHAVRITVSDTGGGMSEQEKERMFDPFFTTKKTGTGLGLAVSHQIVEQHRGVFEVESTPGMGTTITVILPKTKGIS
jgi:two-component system sensor histidine kinase HydH